MKNINIILSFLFLLFFFCTTNTRAAPPPAARLISSRGQVDILTTNATDWVSAFPGMPLTHGTTIRTSENGVASLLIADETLIKLNRNTKFTIKEASAKAGWNRLKGIIPTSNRGAKTRVALDSGEAWFLNKNQDTNFEVETSTVTAAIRGTEFNVRITPEATVHVAVMEGHVMVDNDFGSLTLSSGEEAVTTPGSAPIKQMLLHPADAVQWTIILPSFITPRDLKLLNKKRAVLLQDKETYKRKLTHTPTLEDIIHLTLIYRDLGEPKQAKKTLETIRQKNLGNSHVITASGWLLLDENQFTDALELFEQAKKKSALNLAGSAAALLHLNRLKEAKTVINKALNNFPNTPFLEFNAISLQISRGEIRAAYDDLTDLVIRHENFGAAWELLTLTSLVLDEKKSASIAIEKAKTLLPNSPTPLIIAAFIDQANFNLSKGAFELNQALKLESNNITASIALARIEFGSGNISEAKNLLEKSKKLSPDNPKILNLLGFIQLAQRNKGATETFAKAIGLAPGMAEPRLGAALCQMRAGDEVGALQQISTAVLLDPRRAIFRSYWAKMLYQLGRHKKALEVLDIAKNIDPNDPTPELYRALALKDLKRPTEAIAALQNAISLNDNRAVYRSRFLLDQDLAVKNINLATLFYNLNITDWATIIAADSIKSDYNNSAAHLFYSGSLALDPERSLARDTENLLARLLLPANSNSFNSFNEYTTFFEQPNIEGSFGLTGGNRNTFNQEILVSGSLPEFNLAGQMLGKNTKTDGWRSTNSQDLRSLMGLLKWDISPRNSILFSGETTYLDQEDTLSSQYEYDSVADPRSNKKTKSNALEIGYHFNQSQGLDFLLHYRHQNVDNDSAVNSTLSSNKDLGSYYFDPPANSLYTYLGVLSLTADGLQQDQTKQQYNQYQGQLIFNRNSHQLIAGAINYHENKTSKNNTKVDIAKNYSGWLTTLTPAQILLYKATNPGIPAILLTKPSPSLTQTITQTSTLSFQQANTYFIHDIYKITPEIMTEAALYYDYMQSTQTTPDTNLSINKISPRIGFTWNLDKKYTLRLASFQYLQPLGEHRLEPADIAGIPVYRNGLPGTLVKESDITFDYQWKKGFFAINFFYNDSEYSVKNSFNQLNEQSFFTNGVSSKLNYLPPYDGVGLSWRYDFRHIMSDWPTQPGRDDHLTSFTLAIVRPNGISADLTQTFRHINFDTALLSNEDLFITDFTLSFDLPDKRGVITTKCNNVFDSQFNWFKNVFISQGREPAREYFITLKLFY